MDRNIYFTKRERSIWRPPKAHVLKRSLENALFSGRFRERPLLYGTRSYFKINTRQTLLIGLYTDQIRCSTSFKSCPRLFPQIASPMESWFMQAATVPGATS